MFVRVSIGNLAMRIVVKETGHTSFISILAASHWRKGVKVFQPIGGAVELTETGRGILQEQFGARDFHKDDARFIVNVANLENVLSFFNRRDSRYFELDPSRELREELSQDELVSIPPVLTSAEVMEIRTVFVKTARQNFKDSPGTSTLEVEGVPSRRMFHLFDMVAPRAIMEKMAESEAIKFLTFEEVASTQGGACKGMTNDGFTLADNCLW